tara:strand:- start:420 stop:620 length:201 start_codon:yes stop_codon:yes gene_type:complete
MTKIETHNNTSEEEKPEKNQEVTDRVDINVLMSKIRDGENKRFKRNLTIVFSIVLILAIFGIYAST